MCDQIQKLVQEHPAYGKRKLSILDIGGGKGLLAHFLGQSIDNVEIHVVDISAGAIANGLKKTQRMQNWTSAFALSPVTFQVADASESVLKESKADLVVSLHGCGHLSDIALAHALHRRASFVIAPCCFRSNSHLKIPTDSNGKEARVPVHEWLGIPEEDWSKLKLLAEVQGDIASANLGMTIINSLRTKAMNNKLRILENNEHTQTSGKIEMLSFPVEYSTRNIVLVGRVASAAPSA
jgi:SAM-dependent methyltransferase